MTMVTTKLQLLMVAVCFFSTTIITQTNAEKITVPDLCVNKATCRECIQARNCVWCLKPDFGDKPRCFQPSHPFADGCPQEFQYNPDSERIFILNKELTRGRNASRGGGGAGFMEASGEYSAHGSAHGSAHASGSAGAWGSASASSSGNIVQISPQRVGLKLRINQEFRLNINYSQAEDYPVDLYYLMDLSKSMEDDKMKLSNLGNVLSETMRNITSNFRLGFGSFVDKVLMPYVSTVPKKLESPCDNCEAPYGFKNHMALSTNTTKFSDEVKKAPVSGNLDAPEGGFDAIMQAIVCRNIIGWRDQARRLLVFSTDAGFHYAGDGKLGGVITPNDGKCHMENDEYTHSTIQDYPSISQINSKVKDNSINVIFAVTAQQIDVYNKLTERIEGSSSATLSEDSSNVVDLVRDEYSKISSSVEMKDNATNAVKITYHSSCLGNGPTIQTNKCDGLKVGNVVTFTAEIVVTSCPKNRKDWFQTFQIYPVGINESLIIDLEMLCNCPCENLNDQSDTSSCSGNGALTCGICECDESHFGRKCECSSSDIHNQTNLDGGCRPNNVTMDCSGRGTCICGVCECEKRPHPGEVISGKFCECDNFSCNRHDGLLCSGPDRGTCECGQCVCQPGWTGDSCNCRASNDTCMPQGGGEICSGHGICECGECQCNTIEDGRYSGKFCERCPTCSGRCHEFKECVQCQMYHKGPLSEPENLCANCTLFTPTSVEVLEVNETRDEHKCTFFDMDDCKFQFIYTDKNKDNIEVRAQQKLECPQKVFMLGIVFGVIGLIVLIGLAVLLLWKLVTTIHDRREFAKFEKERMMAKWDTGENPIFKQATSTFKNPTYAGK